MHKKTKNDDEGGDEVQHRWSRSAQGAGDGPLGAGRDGEWREKVRTVSVGRLWRRGELR